MKISKIKELLNASTVCGEELLGSHVYSACGSDMMSDVLAYVKDQAVLLTGLVNSTGYKNRRNDGYALYSFRSLQKAERRDDKPCRRKAGIVLLATDKRMY